MTLNHHLYLDDERHPKTARPWTVVRSYEAFVERALGNPVGAANIRGLYESWRRFVARSDF